MTTTRLGPSLATVLLCHFSQFILDDGVTPSHHKNHLTTTSREEGCFFACNNHIRSTSSPFCVYFLLHTLFYNDDDISQNHALFHKGESFQVQAFFVEGICLEEGVVSSSRQISKLDKFSP